METIGRQELKAKLDANQDIKLVMTIGGWTFRARHIPGSLNFPSPDRALQTLRCDDEIILYSVSNDRQDTRAAFDALTAHGYRNVRCYQGGLADWDDADYPVEGTSVDSAAPRRWPHGHSPDGSRARGRLPTLRQRLVRVRMAVGRNHRPRLPRQSGRHGRWPTRTRSRLAVQDARQFQTA
jgi:rhodanese-related sulfurtransferase